MNRYRTQVLATLLAGMLAACGGGDEGSTQQPASCSVAANKQWLRDYFHGNATLGEAPWYYWYGSGPNPDPAAYRDENAYFDALMYAGTNASFPADRWSFHIPTASFNQFFGAGQTLGYGLFVAGQEVAGQEDLPLYVRYVEPLSPAQGQGLRRGDRILSVNGRTASDLISSDGFGALSPASVSDSVQVVYSRGGVTQPGVTLQAAVFTLTPLTGGHIVNSALGRRMGYIQVKDMISQVRTPLTNTLTNFRLSAVDELIIDLRYNGGGLVSVGRDIASTVVSASTQSSLYARLLFNDRRSNENIDFRFDVPAHALGLSRVFVLAGPRTCSASEQVINGLRGVGVDVVLIGETTCGKPVGFLPADNGCGETYNVVNFESVNQLGQGRYFNGLAATCAVAEDFTQPQGDINEPLLNAARTIADGGTCPTASATARAQSSRASPRRSGAADGERPMMIAH